MDANVLRVLPRAQIQKLARRENIKGNAKTELIIKLLCGKYPGGVPYIDEDEQSKRKSRRLSMKTERVEEQRHQTCEPTQAAAGEEIDTEALVQAPTEAQTQTPRRSRDSSRTVVRSPEGGGRSARRPYHTEDSGVEKGSASASTAAPTEINNFGAIAAWVHAQSSVQKSDRYFTTHEKPANKPTIRPQPSSPAGLVREQDQLEDVFSAPPRQPEVINLAVEEEEVKPDIARLPRIKGASDKGVRVILRELMELVNQQPALQYRVKAMQMLISQAEVLTEKLEEELLRAQGLRKVVETQYISRLKEDELWIAPAARLDDVSAQEEVDVEMPEKARRWKGKERMLHTDTKQHTHELAGSDRARAGPSQQEAEPFRERANGEVLPVEQSLQDTTTPTQKKNTSYWKGRKRAAEELDEDCGTNSDMPTTKRLKVRNLLRPAGGIRGDSEELPTWTTLLPQTPPTRQRIWD